MATYKGRRVTQEYGVKAPYYSKGYHDSIDLAYKHREPVKAFYAGKVIRAQTSGYNAGLGKNIHIQHSDGVVSTYNHLADVRPRLTVGDKVAKGETIAAAGYTGFVIPPGPAGSHLHHGIFIKGKDVNPRKYNGPPAKKPPKKPWQLKTAEYWYKLAVARGNIIKRVKAAVK